MAHHLRIARPVRDPAAAAARYVDGLGWSVLGRFEDHEGFDGVMVSDYTAVAELIAHGVAEDLPHAASLALKAGVDIDMLGTAYMLGLPTALKRGDVTIGMIDDAVRRVLVRLGRGSLVAYAFHVPFCYGALGAPIEGRLDMLQATGFVLLLEVTSFGAVYVRDRVVAMRGAAEA